MTDLEISKALALAIGWTQKQMHTYNGVLMLQKTNAHFARPFDYLDWNVIGPIAAKYDCFPSSDGDYWHSYVVFDKPAFADTPQKAIALAVIQGAKP